MAIILQQVKSRLKLKPEELASIQQATSRRIDRQGIKERCTIVLSAMRCKTICELSRLTSKSRKFIRRWLSRYIEHGVDGLRDRPRSGRPPSLSTDSIEEIRGLCFTSPDYIKSLDEFDHARDSISSSDFWTLAGLAAAPQADRCMHKQLTVLPAGLLTLLKQASLLVLFRLATSIDPSAANAGNLRMASPLRGPHITCTGSLRGLLPYAACAACSSPTG